jgi:DNA-binding NtrC family response regulator
MLVDDEIDIIGLFSEILTLNGISIRPFTNTEEALREFEQNHSYYKLVISDVRMGPMSVLNSSRNLGNLMQILK